MSPSLSFAWTNFMRIDSASLVVLDFFLLCRFFKMLFEKSSKGRRFSFDHTSKFRFTLKAMYSNVKRWVQAINWAFVCMHVKINCENSIAVWIRAAFGILFNTVVCAFTVWMRVNSSFIRSRSLMSGWFWLFPVLTTAGVDACGKSWPAVLSDGTGCCDSACSFLAIAAWISSLVCPFVQCCRRPATD